MHWYFYVPLVIVCVAVAWYLNKRHSETEREKRISETRDLLRGQPFYVDLKSSDGAPTALESKLIGWINRFGGEVRVIPTGSASVAPSSERVLLIQGKCWTVKNTQRLANDLTVDLRLITPDGKIISGEEFNVPEEKREKLFLLILEWLAKPVNITAV